jgi:hypothetical protein
MAEEAQMVGIHLLVQLQLLVVAVEQVTTVEPLVLVVLAVAVSVTVLILLVRLETPPLLHHLKAVMVERE